MGALAQDAAAETARRLRLDDLRAKLAARIGPDSKVKRGYQRNVQMIRAEIARIEAGG